MTPAAPNFPSSPLPLVGSLSLNQIRFLDRGIMWPTTGVRYIPLLPSPDRSPLPVKHPLVRRGNILIALAIFAVVIVVGVTQTFDFQVVVASKPLDIVSPEISPEGAAPTETEPSLDASLPPHIPTYVPATNFLKEHLSMDEIKAMVLQTRGFYTRDYSLGLGWNNVCPLI